MSKKAKIIILVLALVALAVGLYAWNKKKKPTPKPMATKADPDKPGNTLVSDPSNGLNPDLAINASSTGGGEKAYG